MYSHILVPVDGSPTSNAGLDEAIKLAKQLGSRLRLLHVVDQMPLAVSAEGFGVMSVDVLSLLKEAARAGAGASRSTGARRQPCRSTRC